MGNSGNMKSKHEEEKGGSRTSARRAALARTGLGKLLRRERRSRAPPELSNILEAQEQERHVPQAQSAAERSCAVQSNSRAVLQISAVDVVKTEHGRPPTMLTVAYEGWWQTPKVHLLLTLERQQQQQQGKERLLQWFPQGRGPTLRVKGHARTLVLRLYTGQRLTARAEVSLGDLLSSTEEGVARVPLELKKEGDVQEAWVEVAQVSPRPTPLPLPRYPLRFFSLDTQLPPHHLVFPPPGIPTPFRMKQLVQEMHGAPLDNTDWSKPFQFSREASSVGDAITTVSSTKTTTIASPGGPESAPRGTSRTDSGGSTLGGVVPARPTIQYQSMLRGQPASRSVPPSGRCCRALGMVLICLWVLIAFKIGTDLCLAVHHTVRWALDDTQDTERGLA